MSLRGPVAPFVSADEIRAQSGGGRCPACALLSRHTRDRLRTLLCAVAVAQSRERHRAFERSMGRMPVAVRDAAAGLPLAPGGGYLVAMELAEVVGEHR